MTIFRTGDLVKVATLQNLNSSLRLQGVNFTPTSSTQYLYSAGLRKEGDRSPTGVHPNFAEIFWVWGVAFYTSPTSG